MPHAIAAPPNPSSSEPLAEINTTPLIDVMLVLLIMFILTIPIATNTIEVELAQGGTPPLVNPVSNTVTITATDGIEWNGFAISEAELRTALALSLRLPVEPELRFQPVAGASYGRSAAVMNTIKAMGITRFGFVGNEQHAAFGKPGG